MLGILKAGAAYVPVDPSYPDQRIDSMLTDAAVILIISDRALPAWKRTPVLDLDSLNGLPLPGRDTDKFAAWYDFIEQPSVSADSCVACVIFTSGSTGRPKGVIVTHGALTRLGHCLASRYGTGSGDRVLQIAALGFDVAAADFALAFSAGAAICLSAREDLLPGRSLQETIARCGATHAQIPASILAASPVVPNTQRPSTPPSTKCFTRRR